MRSIVGKIHNQCGICNAKDNWVEIVEMNDIHFLYCHKCNTITFFNHIDEKNKHYIENKMNIYSHHVKV